MYKQRSIYVFPDGEKIRIFNYNGESGTEYAETTFARQLIDFLEINMDVFRKAVNNLKSYNDDDIDTKQLEIIFGSIGFLANSFCKDDPVYSFLLSNELELLEKKTGFDTWETAIFRKNQGIEVLEIMSDLQTLLFYLTYVYCTRMVLMQKKSAQLHLAEELFLTADLRRSFQLHRLMKQCFR